MTPYPSDSRQVAALIDHTILRPEATRNDVERVCREALRYQFASVCVNPVFASLVAGILRGSTVKTCSVVGFPLGASSMTTKTYEARTLVDLGAQELDMVIHVGALKAHEDQAVAAEIRSVADTSHAGKALCKVIIETALLTEEEKERACRIARDSGADFVKTSTGFGTRGATVDDVALMRKVLGPQIGVKASGGIRTLDDLLKMVEAGATRIGTSNGVGILAEALAKFNA
ncbi:MAG TPA: deoxyribose-phosphate aldolase [Candidatus Dormibacteraeota bacterium]|nr:deoxyribose-phosphate aldolase [Candidatus Dormibacteraeota bacterium]